MGEIAIVGKAIVSTEETDLTFDSGQQIADKRRELRKPIVKVKIRYVQDAITYEKIRQLRKTQCMMCQPKTLGVPDPTPPKANRS